MPLAKKKGAPKMSRLTSNKRPHKRILGLKSLLRRQALKRRLKNARVKLKAEESRSIDPNKDLKNRSSKKEKKSVLSGAGNSANKATKTFNITTVEELYDAIFQKGYAMKDLIYQPRSERKPLNVSDEVANHPVLSLIAKRVREGSTPGNRAEGDTAKLAMSIEGGGMVSFQKKLAPFKYLMLPDLILVFSANREEQLVLVWRLPLQRLDWPMFSM